jgi:hypothetical protein
VLLEIVCRIKAFSAISVEERRLEEFSEKLRNVGLRTPKDIKHLDGIIA